MPPASASPRALPILVAEDNRINQQVIVAQLTRCGLTAEVFDNGRAALDRWRQGGLSLVLTDLQMPDMDGYELARSIRREEQPPGRIPIVALTANTVVEESSRCQAAGMDDYMTKPVRLGALEAVMARWLGAGFQAPAASIADPAQRAQWRPSGSRQPVDETVLASLIGNDPPALRSFFADFALSAEQTAATLRLAYAQRRHAEVGFLAHRLKGSARSVGAIRLGNLCAHLEAAAASADAGALVTTMTLFGDEVQAVKEWIAAHCRDDATDIQGNRPVPANDTTETS